MEQLKQSLMLSIDKFDVTSGASGEVGPDGRVIFSAPPIPGHYSVVFPELVDWVGTTGKLEIPGVIRVNLKVEAGRIGVAAASYDLVRFVSSEACVDAAPGEQTAELYIDDVSSGCRLVIRNFGSVNISPRGHIASIAYTPASQVSRGDLKRIKARAFGHWYYTADLGDGFVMRATVADEPATMRSMSHNRAVMQWLLQRYFGSATDRRIVDIACSAGFHDFPLAQVGASVVAFDWDAQAIRQANFIQECVGTGFKHKIDFSVGDLYSFSHTDSPFDVVYCSGLFYHLPDPIGGAKRLSALCKNGAVIQSCIAPRDDHVFELSDSQKYPFCASWEFALVPSPGMLKRVFEHAGFRNVTMHRLSEFRPAIDGVRVDYDPTLPLQADCPAYLVCRK